MAGTLIALEGIDGAGTTTQAHRLVDWLQAAGHPAHFTCEPSTGPAGVLIRQLLRGSLERSLDPAAIALLFAADRVDHLQAEILPRLRQGSLVITDRYLYSSLAYQSVGQDLSWIQEINRLAPPPHLTIYLKVTSDTALARRLQRDQDQELFEEPLLQQKIAANYDQLFGNAPAGYTGSMPLSGSSQQDPVGSSGIHEDPAGVLLDPSGFDLLSYEPRLLVLDGAASVGELHLQIIAEVQKIALGAGS